jgi:hypothetical protein
MTNIVETIARTVQGAGLISGSKGFLPTAEAIITALEASGYAIVPVSATPKVLNVADKLDIPRRDAFEFYSRAIQAGKAKG